jgi:acyl carrier protein
MKRSLSADDVRSFLLDHFAPAIAAAGFHASDLDDTFNLLKAGIVDSLGVLELIATVEEHFKITVDFETMAAADLAALGSFSRFVAANAQDLASVS